MALRKTIVFLASVFFLSLSGFLVMGEEQDTYSREKFSSQPVPEEHPIKVVEEDINSFRSKKKEEGNKIDDLDIFKEGSEEIPIVLDADAIEYSHDRTIVTAQGNVKALKGKSVLTCDKATYNTTTKLLSARGNVIFKDNAAVIKADSFDYNLQDKTGEGFNGEVAFPPYYGKGKIIKKISESEILIKNGYITTCDKAHPHYRIQSRFMQIFPQEKVTAYQNTLRVGNTPVAFLPKYTQNLKDDRMHVTVEVGKSRDWGAFILTAWRYDLFPDSSGRVHLDYRERRDFAWGVDNYYDTHTFGKGFFRTYYMRERRLGRRNIYSRPKIVTAEKSTKERERYRVQLRHQWDVSEDTYWYFQYEKTRDKDFIKDYFFREYEVNQTPDQIPSFVQFTHNLFEDRATLNAVIQKRTNRIYTETEQLPVISFTKPNEKVLNTQVYHSNSVTYSSLNSKSAAPSDQDNSNQIIDTDNNFSFPLKIAFLDFNPYFDDRMTYYKRIVDEKEGVFRNAWKSGIDATTRFYRVYDFQGDIWGMEFNKLRHVISPGVGYKYVHPPTAAFSKLLLGDNIIEANDMGFSLENKLQTKRNDSTVDFLRFVASSSYLFKIAGRGRSLSDSVGLDLEILPYSWMALSADADYNRKRGIFPSANFDIGLSGEKLAIGAGYRYIEDTSSQMTAQLTCALIKGLAFTIYERFQFKGNSLLREQNYTLTKDLHCWVLEVRYNVLRELGETIEFALTLKAFPEESIVYNQMYHDPKPGSQGYHRL